jgi:hypothetical protein
MLLNATGLRQAVSTHDGIPITIDQDLRDHYDHKVPDPSSKLADAPM